MSRELDIKIAEARGEYPCNHWSCIDRICPDILAYSMDIAVAWKLIEEMIPHITIEILYLSHINMWMCRIDAVGFKGDTVTEAICEAYLVWNQARKENNGTTS